MSLTTSSRTGQCLLTEPFAKSMPMFMKFRLAANCPEDLNAVKK